MRSRFSALNVICALNTTIRRSTLAAISLRRVPSRRASFAAPGQYRQHHALPVALRLPQDLAPHTARPTARRSLQCQRAPSCSSTTSAVRTRQSPGRCALRLWYRKFRWRHRCVVVAGCPAAPGCALCCWSLSRRRAMNVSVRRALHQAAAISASILAAQMKSFSESPANSVGTGSAPDNGCSRLPDPGDGLPGATPRPMR